MRWRGKVESADGRGVSGSCDCVTEFWGTGAVFKPKDLSFGPTSSEPVMLASGEEGKMLLYMLMMANDCSRKISM